MNKYAYIHGYHAATHALHNENRVIKEIFITKNSLMFHLLVRLMKEPKKVL